ncbi:hypothetical protein H4582DRAFT_134194 [Lactarius indigo]|nr:hypothetical protein H4582DRAFT_134194 [Lactarius indigo]
MAAITAHLEISSPIAPPPPPPLPVSIPPQSYFEIVNSNLLRLGALTLDDFLRDPYQEPTAQENFLSNPLYHDAPVAQSPVVEDKDGESKPAQIPAPIFVLHQICSQTFGSIDALNYEIIEEEGKEKKRCILTITRPNGATRSYTSKPEFARKAAARAAAASVAVDMGAIEFIKYGSPDAVVKRGLVLAPLDAPGSVQAPLPTAAEEDPAVQEIEKCCVEWRAGRVKPRWIFLIDSKPTGKYGCALQIKLSLHLFRACSVDVDYATFELAKAACAADAVAEGILDFIKFGNGQTAPTETRPFAPQEDETQSAPPPIALTLQGFFEALPRPLPEAVDDKTVAEINAPGWLNTLIQSARGGKLELKFIWTTDTKLGTHGAVLRLTRPGEVRTYMVEPQFSKRADAKSAVCLAALAADVGAYVRGIGAAIEAKITPEARSLVFDSIFPLLLSEYGKFWPNKPPEIFEYTKDRDACGCILTLKLTGKPEEHEKRSWAVPSEYRNRNDAKVAVVQLAFEQGAIEFLRFSGEPPPEGYKVELPPPRESKKAKRKAPEAAENEDGNPKKKPKLLSQTGQFLAAVGSSKSAGAPAMTSSARPTSAVPMFLPRPGYVDSKPEPGELPDEPPVTVLPRRPAPTHFQRTRELLPPRRAATEPSLHHGRSEPRGPYDYGAREHGHQYELGVVGARYDDPGVYASDPYYAPPPAPLTEPWHGRAPAPARSYPPEDNEYRRGAYHQSDYVPPPPPPGYDYDYGRHNRYTSPPPLPPEPPAHVYDDDLRRRSGEDYAYGEYAYAHAPPVHHRPQQRTPPPLLSLPPPSPPSDLMPAAPPIPKPRWRAPPPPPSPPRVWQPGPHAPPMSAVAFSRGGAEATVSAPPAVSSSSSSSSSSTTPGGAYLLSKASTPVLEPATKSKTSTTSTDAPPSCKEELIGTFANSCPPCARH